MAKFEDALVELIINGGTFYASLLSQMQKCPDTKDTQTMRVQIKNGRVLLQYNPKWLEPRSMKDTKAVLEHECLHIIMDHHARAQDKDFQLWKVACDLAINQLLSYCPPDALTISHLDPVGKYKRDENAEYYYSALQNDTKMQEQVRKLTGQGEGEHCEEKFETDEAEGVDKELSKEVVKQMVKEAKESAEKGQGVIPHKLQQYLDELFAAPKISWKQVLRQFVSNSVKSGRKASWKRESRRYGGEQKGKIADRTVSITIAIDTSGSIDDGMLTEFMNEVKAIQQCYKSDMTVIECDARVQKVYKLKKFEKLDRDVKGRGGTDFAPVFKWVKEKAIRTDCLIFFTDLAGSFPDRKPSYPTLWAYYNTGWGGPSNVPFGHVVTLEQGETK